MKTLLLSLAFVLGSPFAGGQIQIKYIANAASGGPAPEICRQESNLIRSIVAQYPHPSSWTWVVACDESSWRILANHLGLVSPRLEFFAATDRRFQVTYVRGYTLLHPLRDYPTVPQNVIVHELAHVRLDSADDDQVERAAQQWIKDRPRQVVASADGEVKR